MARNPNLSFSKTGSSQGLFRAQVTAVGNYTISVKIPELSGHNVYSDVPFYGSKPSVNDEIIVGLLNGDEASPVAITNSALGSSSPSSQGDIEGVTAGLGLSGGGTTGTVSLAFAPSELSSVTVATDDKVVIADTSDSDNPKHVTAQSLANLASVSPAGSDHQVQFNNNGSFGADANFTYDGSNLTVKVPLTVGVDDTGHDVKFFGATSGKYMEWDESADQLDVTGSLDVTGNTTMVGTLTIGVDDTGHDVKFFGATSGKYWEWDESNNQMHVAGNILVGEDDTQSITFRTGAAGTEGLLKWVFNQTDGTTYATMGITYDDRATHGFYLDSAYPITLDGTTNINFEMSGTKYGFLEADGDWYFGTSTQQVRVNYDNNDKLLIYDDSATGRPYISFWNRMANGSVERKGYLGYPHAENDNSRIYVRADDGYLDLGGTPGVYVSGSLYIGSTVGPILQNGSGDSLRINNDHGYIDIGAMNDSAEHIYASASTLFLGVSGNAEVRLTSTQFSPSSNEGTDLGSSTYTWNKFWLGQAATFSSGGYYTLRSRDSDRQVMELTSSERFKKDIVDLPLSEAYKVLDARPIKYRGIDDDASVPLEVGLSAESLHNAGYEYAVRYDEGHWGETPRSIYYEYLTAPLIAIIKDLKTRLEALES